MVQVMWLTAKNTKGWAGVDECNLLVSLDQVHGHSAGFYAKHAARADLSPHGGTRSLWVFSRFLSMMAVLSVLNSDRKLVHNNFCVTS